MSIDDKVTGIANTAVKCSLHSNRQKYLISFRIYKPLKKGTWGCGASKRKWLSKPLITPPRVLH